jgi:phosphoglycerate dehydrogenase-like enzyme
VPIAPLLPLSAEERRLLPEDAPLEEADVAVVESFADLPEGTWARAPRLRWIVSLAAGADHVPFAKLPPQARVVSLHGPGAPAIAEHALALLLAAFRRIPQQDRALREGRFDQVVAGRRVAGSEALVLGAGAIGMRIAARADALDMRVRVWRRGGDLDALLADADAIVIALPLTRDTKGLIDAGRLARMKEDAVLVNVARGKIVQREALLDHLRAHLRFTYATDVWWRYPPEAALPENLIGTPHVAALVEGWREERVAEAARVARALSATGKAPEGARVEAPSDYDFR